MNFTWGMLMTISDKTTSYQESAVANTVNMLVCDVMSLQDEVKLARRTVETALVDDPDRRELLKVRDRLRVVQENFEADR